MHDVVVGRYISVRVMTSDRRLRGRRLRDDSLARAAEAKRMYGIYPTEWLGELEP